MINRAIPCNHHLPTNHFRMHNCHRWDTLGSPATKPKSRISGKDLAAMAFQNFKLRKGGFNPGDVFGKCLEKTLALFQQWCRESSMRHENQPIEVIESMDVWCKPQDLCSEAIRAWSDYGGVHAETLLKHAFPGLPPWMVCCYPFLHSGRGFKFGCQAVRSHPTVGANGNIVLFLVLCSPIRDNCGRHFWQTAQRADHTVLWDAVWPSTLTGLLFWEGASKDPKSWPFMDLHSKRNSIII